MSKTSEPRESLPATGANAQQIELWNGRGGDIWTELQERMDQSFVGITRALMEGAALGAGERVLDVGCGTGETSLLAARAVGPSGSVTGVDVSAQMLALARSRGERLPNLLFRLEDASIARFDEPFDAVLSRFGVMFFADPTLAFENIARAVRPGGRLAFVCWQELSQSEWFTLPMRAAGPFLPPSEPPPPDAPGPGAFASRARVESILAASGFADVDLTSCESAVPVGADVDDALMQLHRLGPLSRALADATPEATEKALAAVRAALVGIADRKPLTLSASYWLVRATRR